MDSQGKPEPIFIPAQQIIQGDVENTNTEKGPQVIQGDVHNTNTEQQQQIIYVELKYKPEQNYRRWSYAVIVLGGLIYFVSTLHSQVLIHTDFFWGTLYAACPFQPDYSLMQHFTRANLTGKLRLDNRIQAQIWVW